MLLRKSVIHSFFLLLLVTWLSSSATTNTWDMKAVVKLSTFTNWCITILQAVQIFMHIKSLKFWFGLMMFSFYLIFTSFRRTLKTCPWEDVLAVFHCVFIYEHSSTIKAKQTNSALSGHGGQFQKWVPRGTGAFPVRAKSKMARPVTFCQQTRFFAQSMDGSRDLLLVNSSSTLFQGFII